MNTKLFHMRKREKPYFLSPNNPPFAPILSGTCARTHAHAHPPTRTHRREEGQLFLSANRTHTFIDFDDVTF